MHGLKGRWLGEAADPPYQQYAGSGGGGYEPFSSDGVANVVEWRQVCGGFHHFEESLIEVRISGKVGRAGDRRIPKIREQDIEQIVPVGRMRQQILQFLFFFGRGFTGKVTGHQNPYAVVWSHIAGSSITCKDNEMRTIY
jgi:hypothetical protein